jgi:predicted porin|tara:strand:- start:2384 stop:3319 length:936 start_codon:yes stop_codon:yes gene_type:complete
MPKKYYLSNFFVVFLFAISANINASIDLYGKIGFDSKHISNTTNTEKFDLENNASKIGIKGDLLRLKESNINVIYQIEYEFDVVDGKARGEEGTFKQRNTFLGLKTKLGTVFAGTHDTAFKKSQLKVDLFNDLAPDIKNILHGENRLKDFAGYTSPKFLDSVSLTLNKIKSPKGNEPDYESYSVHYAGDLFDAAFSVDKMMKGYDSSRASFLIPLSKSKLGIIFQESKKLSTGLKKKGRVYSYSRKINPKGVVKFQYASSSMKIEAGKHSTIGYDHKIDKSFKLFTFLSRIDSPNKEKNKNIFSVGLEYKF